MEIKTLSKYLSMPVKGYFSKIDSLGPSTQYIF